MNLRTVGIDPGTNSLGYSVVDYDITKQTFTNIKYGNIKLTNGELQDYRSLNPNLQKCIVYAEILLGIIHHVKPNEVATEHPYISNQGNQSAYPPLMAQVNFLESTLFRRFDRMVLHKYYPTTIKSFFNTHKYEGNAKEKVKKGMLANRQLSELVDISNVETNDEVDAIAIAFTHTFKRYHRG